MATTPNTTPTDLEFIGHIVRDKVEKQPWGKKVANTITAVVGALVSIAAGAMSMGLSLPDWAMLVIVAVTTLGTALGVRNTKNGFSDSQIAKLQAWQADYIDARHTHDEGATPVTATGDLVPEQEGRHRLPVPSLDAAGLTAMVERFNVARRG